MFKLPEHFEIQEFVPPETYALYKDTAIRFISPQIFVIAAGLRKQFGAPIIINNWHRGGVAKYRGYRPPNCTTGAFESPHKRGMALDFNIQGMKDSDVQRIIKLGYDLIFKPLGITEMEEGTDEKKQGAGKGWTHVSCELWDRAELVMIPYFSR